MISVRELPPLRLHLEAVTPSGRHYRWGEDEPDPANIPSGVRHSSTIPGGYESCDAVLPRRPGIDYSDLERFTTINVWGAGGDKAGEYRLERVPSTSGDQMAVSPSAVGWQAHLEDNQSARMIYVDRNVTQWQEGSLARRAAVLAAGFSYGAINATVDRGGVFFEIPNEAIAVNSLAEVFYDAGPGVKVARFEYRGTDTGTLTNISSATINTDSAETGGFASSEALTLDNTIRVATSFTDNQVALLQLRTTGAVTAGAGKARTLDLLAVYGDHGVGLSTGDDGVSGFVASEIVRNAIINWASFLRLGTDTVQPSSFVIPHLTFPERTTAGEIIRQVTRYGLQDWAVWNDRTFYWGQRGAFGRNWRARIAPAELSETGPQVDRLWNSVMVQYQDVDGTTRTVGPIDSGADTETSDLLDSDPDNPATLLGLARRSLLTMGITTAAGAIEVGRRFLEESKALDRSGQAKLVGHIMDDHGTMHPYWRVRAGDTIAFVDAADPSPRRIVRADHDRASRTCTVDLDAPPEGLSALLDRLGAVLTPLGLT